MIKISSKSNDKEQKKGLILTALLGASQNLLDKIENNVNEIEKLKKGEFNERSEEKREK
ncbi:MAG: hypothetical protein ACFFDF_19235 [Candidatus Odinarchaeota archaeon]